MVVTHSSLSSLLRLYLAPCICVQLHVVIRMCLCTIQDVCTDGGCLVFTLCRIFIAARLCTRLELNARNALMIPPPLQYNHSLQFLFPSSTWRPYMYVYIHTYIRTYMLPLASFSFPPLQSVTTPPPPSNHVNTYVSKIRCCPKFFPCALRWQCCVVHLYNR